MSQDITIKYIQKLANDVKLNISEEKAKEYVETEKLILQKFEKVTSINTDGVDPIDYPFEVVNTYLREDSDSRTITKESIMQNAPQHDDEFVTIAKVVK